MTVIEPTPLEPAPSNPLEIVDVQQMLDNLIKNANAIIQVPADIGHGASAAWDWVSNIFADPKADPPPPAPVVTPPTLSWVPTPDPFVTYSGLAPQPTWNDVFNWQQQTSKQIAPTTVQPSPISGAEVQHAIDVAVGQTIKALGGFINQNANLSVLAADVLGQRIADTQTVIGALTANQHDLNTQHQNVLNLITTGSLPQLWAEIAKTQAEILNEAKAQTALIQKWATDNIHKPLEENIAQEKALRIAEVDQVKQSLPGIIHDVVTNMGLATAASVATIAAQVAPLVQESTDCTQPMCETMGPKTDLGKLLKALSLAADAAFIAELLSMDEAKLVAFLQTAFGKVASVVNAVETGFLGGGETIGQFVKNTITGAV